LSPACHTQIEADQVQIYHESGWLATLSFSHQGEINTHAGGPSYSGGWYSPRFGIKLPAPRIAWRGRLSPEGLTTKIDLSRPASINFQHYPSTRSLGS
jgi:hypothetical protein